MHYLKNISIAGLLLSVFCRCSTDKTTVEDYQSVKIDMSTVIHHKDYHKIFSKIEIVPLQTADSILVGNIREFTMTDDYFVVQDNQAVISVFDKTGNFISNSSENKGQGPEDYAILMGMAYNENTQCVDVLTPYHLISYNLNFQFKGKSDLPTYTGTDRHASLFFDKLFATGENKYMLFPTTISKDAHRIVLYDSKKGEIIKEVSYEEDVISALTQQVQNMNNLNEHHLSFSPFALTYFLYAVDLENFSIKKKYKLDFGNSSVTAKDLKMFKTEREKVDYLAFESKKPLPLRNFFNRKYLVSIIRCSNEYYTFVKQLETDRDYLIKNSHLNEKINIPAFDGLKNDILYSIVTPVELEKYLDTTLLSDKDKLLSENIAEEDNPVVIKYYLK
jgi:hypothetical protein